MHVLSIFFRQKEDAHSLYGLGGFFLVDASSFQSLSETPNDAYVQLMTLSGVNILWRQCDKYYKNYELLLVVSHG